MSFLDLSLPLPLFSLSSPHPRPLSPRLALFLYLLSVCAFPPCVCVCACARVCVRARVNPLCERVLLTVVVAVRDREGWKGRDSKSILSVNFLKRSVVVVRRHRSFYRLSARARNPRASSRDDDERRRERRRERVKALRF